LGGIERVIERLSEGIANSPGSHEVAVLTTKYLFPRRYARALPSQEMIDGVTVHRLDGWPHTAPPFFSVPLVWFRPGDIDRFIGDFRPDILHWMGDGWFWGHYFSARAAGDKAGIVFSPSFHRLTLDKQWLRPINRLLCRRVDAVTVLSHHEARLIALAYGIPEGKLVLLPWGADLPGSSAGEMRSPEITVLCVGRLGEHKDQDFLLDVWAASRQRFQRPARLILVGRDEGGHAGRAHLGRRIAESDLNRDVTITGEVSTPELQAWYHRAHIFSLFSHYEAFGLVFFEAMAAGLPVLTHAVGANRELLCRGSIVVGRHDLQAASDALVRLVNDEALRSRLSLEAQIYAQDFAWQAVVDRTLALYDQVLTWRRPALQDRSGSETAVGPGGRSDLTA
jgi:glycosyltransferase involved in cell wall biosynthesis